MPTRIVGERFHIYASRGGTKARRHIGTKGKAKAAGIWSADLVAPGEDSPLPWMVELANALRLFGDVELPTGVIVGSAVIERCVRMEAQRHEGTQARREDADTSDPACLDASVPPCLYEWHLTDVQRLSRPRRPAKHPQPVWFKPF